MNTNEYGVPLHACHGYRHDAHYWSWIRHSILTGTTPWDAYCRQLMEETK